MNLPELFIRRPVMATLITVAIAGFGLMAFSKLAVSDLPDVDMPTLVVSASLPGAAPETMAAAVATPLERQFTTIAGVDSMISVNTLGATQITLQFSLDRSLDGAAQDVQAAISAVLRQLPPDMPTPPSFTKVNPSDDPVFALSLNSATLELSKVDEFAETVVAQRISSVPGVAQVNIRGSKKYAVRVQLNPQALAARGIGMEEVRQAISTGNVNLPTGTVQGRHQALTVRATGQLQDAEAYRGLIVAYRHDSPVRLEDLGNVVDDVQDKHVAGYFNATSSIVLLVQRQPGTNIIEVADAVKALLPGLRAQLPASVNLDMIMDRSVAIRESVNDAKFTLVLAIILVVLVIFLFLRSISATVIPSIAMPIAVAGSFGVMYFFGFSIDNLSLLGLTLSVGFVVDDAIVMLENIVRHMEKGLPPLEAALTGSREIGFTIISMTLSLVAVFIPVLFMGGLLGRLLREFAITISAAILVSGFISLTLTPMLCSRFLKPVHAVRPNRAYAAIERVFQAALGFHRRLLTLSLRHSRTVLAAAGVLVLLTAWLIIVIPKGFIPSDDGGRIRVNIEAAEDISFDSMVQHMNALAAVVGKNPSVRSYTYYVGSGTGGASTAGNIARLNLNLIDRSKRPNVAKIVEELRPKLAAVPGIKTFVQVAPSISIGGRSSSSLYQYSLYGTDLDELYRVAPDFAEKIGQISGVRDVTDDLQVTSPQILVDLDRDKAAVLGITAQQIEDTLFNAFGQRQVSTIYTSTNQYYVIMEVEPRYQRDAQALSLLYVRAPTTGRLVPIEAVARLRRTYGPLSVTHLGQLPAVTISFNLTPGVALGDVTPLIDDLARRELPASISTAFQGTAAAFASSLRGLGLLLLIAIAVIYLVLGILYEDFIHPLTILSGLPAAGFGALLTLVIFHEELNIYGYVGIIMLIGIMKKNAIMMVDYAIEKRKCGHAAAEAIQEAGIVRFRPIMMTTLAALAGTMPIALGWGAGAESRRSLGLAVVGGLVVSQLLTLYITPVVYVGLERFARRKAVQSVPANSLTMAAGSK